jgi:hypothetical protein
VAFLDSDSGSDQPNISAPELLKAEPFALKGFDRKPESRTRPLSAVVQVFGGLARPTGGGAAVALESGWGAPSGLSGVLHLQPRALPWALGWPRRWRWSLAAPLALELEFDRGVGG